MQSEGTILTRQDKTRQDKTRQDKTRQDKTRQDKTRRLTATFFGVSAEHVVFLAKKYRLFNTEKRDMKHPFFGVFLTLKTCH